LYFAIGCLGPGVFSTEPIYKNIKEFENDLDDFLSWGVKNLVIFNLEGLLERKQHKTWIQLLKNRL
jgi:hypothetical protein